MIRRRGVSTADERLGTPAEPWASGGRGEGLMDEPEIEGHFPREDEPPPVAHPCDGRARQHPPRWHPDDLRFDPAHQDQARVPDDLYVGELHASGPVHHRGTNGGARETRRSGEAPWRAARWDAR